MRANRNEILKTMAVLGVLIIWILSTIALVGGKAEDTSMIEYVVVKIISVVVLIDCLLCILLMALNNLLPKWIYRLVCVL